MDGIDRFDSMRFLRIVSHAECVAGCCAGGHLYRADDVGAFVVVALDVN